MKYMLNVDLETKNVTGGKGVDCSSGLHASLGPHYDVTVHALGSKCKTSRAPKPRFTRYWDDNKGEGYTLEQVVEEIAPIHARCPDAYARRCSRCNIDSHRPHWD